MLFKSHQRPSCLTFELMQPLGPQENAPTFGHFGQKDSICWLNSGDAEAHVTGMNFDSQFSKTERQVLGGAEVIFQLEANDWFQ